MFFSLMMVLQFVLVLWFLPETKGVALEQMAATMRPSALLPIDAARRSRCCVRHTASRSPAIRGLSARVSER